MSMTRISIFGNKWSSDKINPPSAAGTALNIGINISYFGGMQNMPLQAQRHGKHVIMADVMKKRTVLAAFLALSLTGCGISGQPKTTMSDLYSNISLDAGFDTVFYYQEYNADSEASASHFETAVSLFSRYNELFDIYNDYEGISNIKTINDFAGIAPVTVDGEIIEMLTEARNFYELSNHEFDVTIGSLLQVWHAYREEGTELNAEGKDGSVPSAEELQTAAVQKGWDKIEIDAEASTVYITDPDVSLDVGGIAKGFAVEKIAEYLSSLEDIGTVTINAGGNNRTINGKPDGSTWNVRIQNPDGGSRMILVSAEGSVSFVTSGDYERYYTADNGKRYHHIIDPETCFPADRFRSVTVITEDSGAADCLTTSLFTLSIDEGKKLLSAYEEQSGKRADAIWIMDQDSADLSQDGTYHMEFYVVCTDGIRSAVTFEQQ